LVKDVNLAPKLNFLPVSKIKIICIILAMEPLVKGRLSMVDLLNKILCIVKNISSFPVKHFVQKKARAQMKKMKKFEQVE
jgi:hypothetical protein